MAVVLGLLDGSELYSDKIVKRHDILVREKKLSFTQIVAGNSVNDNESIIMLAAGVPAVGSRLRGMVCRTRSAQQQDSGSLLWHIAVKFDNKISEDDEEDEQDKDPTARKAKWKWGAEIIEERLQYDAINGDDITNSAFQPILVSHPVAIPVLTIQRYERFPFDPRTIINYVNYVSDGEFWGAKKGNALMASIETGFDEVINEIRVVPVTYKIKFKIEFGKEGGGEVEVLDNSWQFRPIDEGTKYFENGAWKAAADKLGNPIKVNLDGEGGKLADGEELEHRNYNRYPQTNFDALTLGPFA